MKMSVKQLTKYIKKMIDIIKPVEVEKIDFTLEPISDNEFYMDVTYVVPDDSEFLTKKHYDNLSHYYSIWNEKIKKGLRNYLDIKAIVNQTGITSQSFYEKEKQWQAKN